VWLDSVAELITQALWISDDAKVSALKVSGCLQAVTTTLKQGRRKQRYIESDVHLIDA
jgi:hypothetical protein